MDEGASRSGLTMDESIPVAFIPPDPEARFSGFPLRVVILAVLLLTATFGCASRQPGETYSWTTHTHTVGDEAGVATYMGFGRAF